jgi:hypothetical protein
MTNRILVGAVFLVGCAVGGASSQLVVPKASAQQAATLTKWEYNCVRADWGDFGATSMKFGAEGWEMVSFTQAAMNDTKACFKRPKL